MALGPLQKQILYHRRVANTLRRRAVRRHLRAAQVGRRALLAKANGHHLRAKHLLQRAFDLKAGAARTFVRSRFHRRQIASLRQMRRLYMQKHVQI
jgi:hypothetical protein